MRKDGDDEQMDRGQWWAIMRYSAGEYVYSVYLRTRAASTAVMTVNGSNLENRYDCPLIRQQVDRSSGEYTYKSYDADHAHIFRPCIRLLYLLLSTVLFCRRASSPGSVLCEMKDRHLHYKWFWAQEQQVFVPSSVCLGLGRACFA